MRVGLVACSRTKADRPTVARELYTSPLFRAARAYAERSYDTWLILSARHGAARPTTLLAPYDLTLARIPAAARQAWARRVHRQLADMLGDLHAFTFFLHAGSAYVVPLCPYLPIWNAPLQGLRIGEQLGWYRRQRRDS